MKIEDVMVKDVATCFPEDSVQDAATLMASYDTGTLVVLESGEVPRVVGIVTDRDICMAVARQEVAPGDLSIRRVMSSPAHCCRPDDALWELLTLAETYHVRRFPVVDADRQLLGIVSLDDAAREAARERPELTTLSALEVCRAIAVCSGDKHAEALLLGR